MSLLFVGSSLTANSQEARTLRITGVVKNQAGDPLIGVVVQEKGTNNILATDNKGAFTMYNVAPQGAVLEFTYIGYKTTDIKIENDKPLVVVLEDATVGVDEVVVTGLNTQKRESVVGSIATVSPTALKGNTSVRLSTALAGQLAGVVVQQKSGHPVAGATFLIRGVNTFVGEGQAPLVLVDGVERDMNTVSVDEIETISVLKDAAASAVYGVRGANGVVIITTKRGQVGKPVVTARYEHSFNTPVKMPEFVDGAKYMEVTNAANELLNGPGRKMFTQQQIDNTRNGVDTDAWPSVNWLDECFRDWAGSDKASIDVSGGTELIRYSLVAALYNGRGLTTWDETRPWNSKNKQNQINVRSTIDINVTNSTLVTFSVGTRISDENLPHTTVGTTFNQAFSENPIAIPKLYSNGTIPMIPARVNPWAALTQTGYAQYFNTTLNSLIAVEQDWGKVWKPLTGLKMSAAFSYDAYSWNNRHRDFAADYWQLASYDVADDGVTVTNKVFNKHITGTNFLTSRAYAGGNRTKYGEWKVAYDRAFGKHTMGLLLTGNLKDYLFGDGIGNDLQLFFPKRRMGIAGRAAYSYDNRYFAEFNFGYNGTDNFAPGLRYGFFPSVAVGWMITNEKFMEGSRDVLNKLKIRASWGQLGNDVMPNNKRWGYITTVYSGQAGYSYGYNLATYYSGKRQGEFGADGLTWETETKYNVGLEIGLLNKIDLTVEAFLAKRKDIFMQRKTIPEIAGFSTTPYANYGKMENRGIEATLLYNHQINKDLYVSFRGTFSFIRNKVTEYDEPASILGTTRSQLGHPWFTDAMLVAEGLYTDDDFANKWTGELKEGVPSPTFGVVKPGDIKYKDVNGDGIIDALDKEFKGHPYNFGEINYGFGANLVWKWLDFSFFFQGVGNYDYMLTMELPGTGAGSTGNIYTNVDDRWTPEIPNQDVFWPRLTIGKSTNNSQYSTWWMVNGNFLRLKNIELGFTLPKKWQNAARMRNARLFLRGTNILTFSKFDLWDPEVTSGNGAAYPNLKAYTVGVEVAF